MIQQILERFPKLCKGKKTEYRGVLKLLLYGRKPKCYLLILQLTYLIMHVNLIISLQIL